MADPDVRVIAFVRLLVGVDKVDPTVMGSPGRMAAEFRSPAITEAVPAPAPAVAPIAAPFPPPMIAPMIAPIVAPPPIFAALSLPGASPYR